MASEARRSEQDLERAVGLVLRDVAAVFGDGAIAVARNDRAVRTTMADLVAAEPELLDHLTSNGLLDDVLTGPPMPSSEWLVFVPGEHGSVGLSVWNDPPFVDLVERTADIVQEVIMESERFFGAAFPPCPEHPNTPLWPKVVEGEAVWSCIDGGATAIRIGTLAPAETA